MTAGTVAESLRQLLRRPIEAATGEVVLVSADGDVLRVTVSAVADLGADAPERVRVRAPEAAFDRVSDDLVAASRATDLVEAGRLSLLTVADGPLPSVLVTADDALVPLPLPDGRAIGFRSDDGAVVSAVRTAFGRDEASEYRLAVPGYSRLLDELEAEVGATVREEFAAALSDPVTVRSGTGTLDEIDTALLLGARNRAQLYGLSEWAETVGLASRATVSARKRRLEAAGLLATEKVTTDVGRPRQRLVLAEESLSAVGATDLVRAAQSVLVEGR